ncbi:ras-related and estrogen-regulated growth inhibitor-like protein isoform X1 [Cloeon dipterum]|uniref:ras-related and estrogen-regulated growth inhibitor-like protein isoform X1 n=1 Tax=Cloeon dipterum TaxID=197152 RepID=UPI0032209BAA
MTAAKSPFARLRAAKPLRIMVLGQGGVGKSALVVRFLTRRFIGEYDPTLEKMYTFNNTIDNEVANLEILDTAGQPHETECPGLEANIRWADVFILMYSVTDKCSFDECSRLKFLINYNKRRRRLSSSARVEPPVLLVGNKSDQIADRMVTFEEGHKRSADIGCVSFHEISVRENIEEGRRAQVAVADQVSTPQEVEQRGALAVQRLPKPQHSISTANRRAAVGGRGAVPGPGQHGRHPALPAHLAPAAAAAPGGPAEPLGGTPAGEAHEHLDAWLAHRQLKTHLPALPGFFINIV